MGESNEDICDQEQRPPSSNSLGCVSCTTFNILAPIYKRLEDQVCLVVVRIVLLEEVAWRLWNDCCNCNLIFQHCESEFHELWLNRNESILDRLLDLGSSIICLQVFCAVWGNNIYLYVLWRSWFSFWASLIDRIWHEIGLQFTHCTTSSYEFLYSLTISAANQTWLRDWYYGLFCQFWFVIVSQEFWVQNEELVRMYEKRLGDAGYQTFKLPRTNNRGDGTLTNFVSSILLLLEC